MATKKSDLLNGLASVAGEVVKKAASKDSGTSAAKKTTTTKKVTKASESTETTKGASALASAAQSLMGGLDISSLLTGAVTSAVTQNVAKKALGFEDVNGDGKIDLTDILQTIVKSVQGGKVDIKSLSGAITNVWNTAFKAGQDSKK